MYQCVLFQNPLMLIGKYIFVLFLSLFAIRNFRRHAHLSKCWRGTLPEKVWQPLSFLAHNMKRSFK